MGINSSLPLRSVVDDLNKSCLHFTQSATQRELTDNKIENLFATVRAELAKIRELSDNAQKTFDQKQKTKRSLFPAVLSYIGKAAMVTGGLCTSSVIANAENKTENVLGFCLLAVGCVTDVISSHYERCSDKNEINQLTRTIQDTHQDSIRTIHAQQLEQFLMQLQRSEFTNCSIDKRVQKCLSSYHDLPPVFKNEQIFNH